MRRRHSVRLRLTLLYGGLFLVAGGVLLAVTYLLTVHSPLPGQPDDPDVPEVEPPGEVVGEPGPSPPPVPATPPVPTMESSLDDQLAAQRDADRRRLVVGSLAALALMGAGSMGLGWFVAGRVLRPIATMTTTARRLSADDLHRRLAADGPDDELKELSDTFDELLDRLESAFESQRRFVANASHELRTPLTLQRTLVEVAMADPDAGVESLRATCAEVVAETEHQERIIDALLVLARSQRGLDRRDEVDLAALTQKALDGRRGDVERRCLRLRPRLEPAPTIGDPEMLERLVANLVDNAVGHNVDGGWIDVSTGTAGGSATVGVINGGASIPAELVDCLTQPFRRLGPERTDGRRLGLGLSIVDAIVVAHAGTLSLRPNPDGGLTADVRIPARPTAPPTVTAP